jgi:MFS transporter, PAT family, beta-lactamase induction signal transducer AmpG
LTAGAAQRPDLRVTEIASAEIGAPEPPAAARPARAKAADVLRALRRPKVAVMLGLGFASGLPFLLIGNTLSYWLGDAHVNLALIGYLSWVGMAYSLKFIWGAVVDSLPPPLFSRLGRRRGWMLWMQLGVMAGLVGMAASDPHLRLQALTAFALLTAFAAATQDVVIDAWRIETADDAAELDLLTASYKLGYQIAVILTASVILLMASGIGWPASYAAFGVSMVIGLAATLFAREPARADTVMATKAQWSSARALDAVVGPFVAFFRQFGPTALLILLLVSAYHLSDYLRGPVINPFYVQVGLKKAAVAGIRLSVGLPFTVLGIAAGGLFAARFGHWAALIVGAILQPLAVASFAVLASTGPNLGVFSGCMALDDFCMNFAGVALIAYMSTLTSLGYTATQYALLTSALAWTGKFLKGFSGQWVLGLQHRGGGLANAYAVFFLEAAAVGVVALVLCLVLAAMDRRHARGLAAG